MIWNMDNASPAAGGYMDLQTDGNRFDSTRGDTVIFSIWGSRSYEGPSCAQFPYESGGTGYSCRLPYPINVDRWYRLRAWKLSSIPAGVWWGAWILFESTGADIFIGKLEVSPPETNVERARVRRPAACGAQPGATINRVLDNARGRSGVARKVSVCQHLQEWYESQRNHRIGHGRGQGEDSAWSQQYDSDRPGRLDHEADPADSRLADRVPGDHRGRWS